MYSLGKVGKCRSRDNLSVITVCLSKYIQSTKKAFPDLGEGNRGVEFSVERVFGLSSKPPPDSQSRWFKLNVLSQHGLPAYLTGHFLPRSGFYPEKHFRNLDFMMVFARPNYPFMLQVRSGNSRQSRHQVTTGSATTQSRPSYSPTRLQLWSGISYDETGFTNGQRHTQQYPPTLALALSCSDMGWALHPSTATREAKKIQPHPLCLLGAYRSLTVTINSFCRYWRLPTGQRAAGCSLSPGTCHICLGVSQQHA